MTSLVKLLNRYIEEYEYLFFRREVEILKSKQQKRIGMDLFVNDTKVLLERYVSKDWAEVLSNYISEEAFGVLKSKIYRQRGLSKVYPEPKDVFKALRYPFENIKVVIVGQDPYHNGNADGLAFSCKKSLSPSLRMILQAMSNDNQGQWSSTDLNLNYLAEQGVFLYNPTLTVEEGKPGSHKGIWDNFTKGVFQALNNKENLVWLMWGNDAYESVGRNLGIGNSKHLFLQNEHPAAASYAKREWSCSHFSKANKYLKERNMEEIKWLL